MNTLSLFLKLASPIFLVVGALHLTLGLGADVLLGARIPEDVLSDPALDSQNRFYGVAFALYGFLLFICASNLRKYTAIFHCVIWVFFAAGVARLISMAIYGIPPPLVLMLLASELALPPLLAYWYLRAVAHS